MHVNLARMRSNFKKRRKDVNYVTVARIRGSLESRQVQYARVYTVPLKNYFKYKLWMTSTSSIWSQVKRSAKLYDFRYLITYQELKYPPLNGESYSQLLILKLQLLILTQGRIHALTSTKIRKWRSPYRVTGTLRSAECYRYTRYGPFKFFPRCLSAVLYTWRIV